MLNSRIASLGLLLLIPVAPLLHFETQAAPSLVFLAGALGIAVLADRVRRATEHISAHVGPALGGLLNVSFGSLAELILALFVLVDDRADIVKAQITGSIIGTGLLGLGVAVVVGGVDRGRQTFKRERAGLLSSLLLLAVIAMLLPAIFDYTTRHMSGPRRLNMSEEALSLGISAVLLMMYAGNLVYTLLTHRDIFAEDEPRDGGTPWPLWAALAVLCGATAAIALEAELVSGALEATASSLHLSSLFLGVIVLALVGTASDLFAATWFARQNKMGLVLNICIGSAIQMALVVAPLLVIVSWLIGHPMTLVFGNPLNLFAIAGTAVIVNSIAGDGETTWFEGVLLIGVYILLALAFFFVG